MSEEKGSEEASLLQYILILLPLGLALAVVGVVVIYFLVPMSQIMTSVATRGMVGEIQDCLESPMAQGVEDPVDCLDEVSTLDWWMLAWGDRVERDHHGVGIRSRMEAEALMARHLMAQRVFVDQEAKEEARRELWSMVEGAGDDEEKREWFKEQWRAIGGKAYRDEQMMGDDGEAGALAVAAYLRDEAPSEWARLAEVPQETDGRQVLVAAALCLVGESEAAERRIAYIAEESEMIGVYDETPPVYSLAVACGVEPEVVGRSSFELNPDQQSTEGARLMALVAGKMSADDYLDTLVEDRRFRVRNHGDQAKVITGLLSMDEGGQEFGAWLEELGERQERVLRRAPRCNVPTQDRYRGRWMTPGLIEELAGRMGTWRELDEAGEAVEAFEDDLWLEAARQWAWLAQDERARAALDQRQGSTDEDEQWCEALIRTAVGDVEEALAIQQAYEGEESRWDWDGLGFELLALSGEFEEVHQRGLSNWDEDWDLEKKALWFWASMESGHYEEAYRRVTDTVGITTLEHPAPEVFGDAEALAWWRMEPLVFLSRQHHHQVGPTAMLFQWVSDDVDGGEWLDVVRGPLADDGGLLDHHWQRIRAKEAVGREADAAERRAIVESIGDLADEPEKWWLISQL